MKPNYIFRLVIIGDREVGRRTFLRKSIDDHFFVEDHLETIGVEAYKKELFVGECVINFMIWNVSNKESFRRDLRIFISGSDVVILFYDLTNLNSFTYLSEFPRMIKEYAGDIPIYLIGNKLDLVGVRKVSGEDIRNFASDNNLMGYMEISAGTGLGCEEVFERIGSFLYNYHGLR